MRRIHLIRFSLRAIAGLAMLFAGIAIPMDVHPAAGAASGVHSPAAEGALGCDFAAGSGLWGSGQTEFNRANLDRSVSPCSNFFEFADGGWIKDHPIPPQYPAWGTFAILAERNRQHLWDILKAAAADQSAKPGSNWRKIGDFYSSCMDTKAIEAAGLSPLDSEFQRIAAIRDPASLQAEMARLQSEGVNVMFEFGSQQDFKDSTREIAIIRQGGLGLPDRDYYLKDDAKSKQLREEYLQHVARMLELAGDSAQAAAAESQAVLKIETGLARASMPRVDLRDPDKVYHNMSLSQLRALAPNLSWEEYAKQVSAPAFSRLNVAQPDFFRALSADFSSVPLADWKVYLRWHLLHEEAPALPDKFYLENFNFYGRTLTGAQKPRERWQRCVIAADNQLGEALGQYYVKRYFPPQAKAQAVAMVKNLEAALRADLQSLDWMSPATRKQAAKKLDAIMLKIGYPDTWRDYSKYRVTSGPYVENVLRGDAFEFAWHVAKIGKPVDRTEWDMTPPTVNAYYNPSMNEIVFPAGILQPPFFDPDGDPAINYGGIGAVIGHEMTHGFDDEGAKFDARGNLRNWWTPQDYKNFQQRGDCIARQFDGYEVEAGLTENGKLVEGESIADLGGLTLAHMAFQKTPEGQSKKPVGGFTPDQRFFLGFAQVWAGSYRIEAARLLAKTDPHPLPKFRTNGPLSNMPSFAKAWGCHAGSAMVRPHPCRIW